MTFQSRRADREARHGRYSRSCSRSRGHHYNPPLRALWLAKRIRPIPEPDPKTGLLFAIESTSRARTFDVLSTPLRGLDDVAALLLRLVDDPHAAIIRGGLIDPTRTRRVRRLLYADPKTGNVATFRDQALGAFGAFVGRALAPS